jgi:hypothetical protein
MRHRRQRVPFPYRRPHDDDVGGGALHGSFYGDVSDPSLNVGTRPLKGLVNDSSNDIQLCSSKAGLL